MFRGSHFSPVREASDVSQKDVSIVKFPKQSLLIFLNKSCLCTLTLPVTISWCKGDQVFCSQYLSIIIGQSLVIMQGSKN